jgi:glycine betaine/proline transport system substrate-binding protein
MLNKKIIVGALVSLLVSSSLFGTKITALKTSIAEESFQMKIVVSLLQKMGYDVDVTNGVGYDIAYQMIADNAKNDDVYFMAANWDPLHNTKLESLGVEKFAKYSEYISGCAQGYLIDKKTADKYNIKYINDLKDPKIAKLFDTDNDGKADLAGCSGGWGCEKVIEHQLDVFKLRDTIEHNQGEYSALIADVIANYKTGKPIFYYTWTPYWISGKLVPGRDVVFLQVKYSASPNGYSTKLSNGADYGFAINSQKIVSNASVKTKHKDIAKLFEVMKLDVNDVSGENMLMADGQKKERDIDRHVKKWLQINKSKVDSWIKAAKAAK